MKNPDDKFNNKLLHRECAYFYDLWGFIGKFRDIAEEIE